jgi:hypothetical protein
MCQPSALYATSPALHLLEPWMQARLPKVVDPTARQHIIQQLLAEMAPSELYLTIDESSHLSDFDIFGVGLATDGMSIPLGWILYTTDEAWAEDARDLLTALADYLPSASHIIVLADRIHTGEPFLACLESLGWDYVFRATADTQIETSRGSPALRALSLRSRRARFLQQVRSGRVACGAPTSAVTNCRAKAIDPSSGILSPA